MNKIVLRKTTSAIFLVIVLVIGTIALSIPSFIVGAQAESDDDEESDNYNNKLIRTEDNDDESSEDEDEAKDNDDESDNDELKANENNLNENNNDEIKEVSYSSANNNYYKSEDSSSVNINKIKCNNINVNLNGVDVDVGLPNNGPVNGPISLTQAANDEGVKSFESNDVENGQSYSETNSRIICINNNNNIVVGEEQPEPETCEECFEAFLTPEQIEVLLNSISFSTLEEACDFLLTEGAGSKEDFITGLEIIIGVSEDNAIALVECLEDAEIDFSEDPL